MVGFGVSFGEYGWGGRGIGEGGGEKGVQLCRLGRGSGRRGRGCTLCRRWRLRRRALAASLAHALPRS